MPTTLHIKHMVCNRCIMAVKERLSKLGFEPESIRLGIVVLNEDLTTKDIQSIREELEPIGFELIDDKRIRIVEQIKSSIIEQVHYTKDKTKMNLSDFLTDKLHYEYTYISNLFSEIENTTIEQYYIAQKIERIKELLVYDELSLNEIAYLMDYSSSAYLSSQFKKVTGLTPSHFKKIKNKKRKPLDNLK